MSSIWLAHVTAYDPAIPGLRTLYFSSQCYTTGTSNVPPGGAENTAYDPRIKQPAVLRRDCFDAGTTGGASRVGYGALELVNVDGGLDFLADLGMDGRPFTLIFGSMSRNGAPAWQTVLTGTIEQPAIGWSSVTLRIRDRQAELAKPLSPTTYLGNNALPNGLEGVDELKGKAKPRLFGRVFNISPILVNTSRLIYQVSDGLISSVDAVYDRGLALAKGANYVNQADMEANAPAPGLFRVWPYGGYFRLGSSPTGIIAADAWRSGSSTPTAAQTMLDIVYPFGCIAASSYADIAALDASNSAGIGHWISDATNINVVLDEIANSAGAWWGFDRLGNFRTAQFAEPSGAPAAYLAASDIIKIDRVASNDAGRGIPAWKVKLNYKKFYTVQPSDLAGAVSVARRADLLTEYRTVDASDTAIQTRHKLATELEFSTLLYDAAAAQTEANRRLTMYKSERATYTARLGLDPALLSTIDLGAVVRLTLPRFGMSAGRDFRVIGLQPDYRLGVIDITLWG